jgi:2-phosphoglycerate kinase
MFQLKLHSNKTAFRSHHWYEQLAVSSPEKRIVGKRETKPYQRGTLANSVHRACMKSFGFSGEAEVTALRVCHEVEAWLEDKEEVTKQDIRRIAASALSRYNPRAAYEYLPTKDLAVTEDQYGFIRL